MTLRRLHWAEYAIEAAALGLFMVSACVFGTLIFRSDWPVYHALGTPLVRNAVMGVLMGLTAIAIIYSPWGKRSGGHMNPAFTVTFLRLGKIAPRDAAGYVVAQFAGGFLGVLLARLLVGVALGHPSVRYVVTQPGPAGTLAAVAGEIVIAFVLMSVVLNVQGSRWERYTGVLAGLLVALFIAVESPLSGMSLNPARSVASALAAWSWTAMWIYFVGPLGGMLLAARVHNARRRPVPCPKYAHATPCIFCEYHAMKPGTPAPPSSLQPRQSPYHGGEVATHGIRRKVRHHHHR